MILHRHLWAACFGVVMLAVPTAGFAQAVDLAVDAEADHVVTEDRIVVTGTRSAKAIDEQAGNTARLEAIEIEFAHADHIAEILNRLPGVSLHRGNGQEHLTAIRSPVLNGGAGAGSFLYLENGVPMRAAGFSNINGLFESHSEIASAIEVVRGPGSSLYGSNAVHGLINIVPRRPDGSAGFLEVVGGSFGRARTIGWLSEDIGDHHFLIGGSLVHEAGYRDEAGFDQQKLTARHMWNGPVWSSDTLVSFVNLNQETAGYVFGLNAYEDRDLSEGNVNPEAFRDAYAFRISSRWERELSNGALLSLTPYARSNEMDFRMHFLPSKALEESGHQSMGLLSSLTFELGAGEIIAGADVEWTNGTMWEFQSIPTVFSYTQGLHYDYEVAALVLAGYVHGEWPVNDHLRLVAGARLEHVQYEYDNQTDTNTVGRFQRVADRSDDFTSLTPRLGAVVDIDEAWSAYVNYARGARAPQTTDLYRLQINQVIGEIEEEELDSIEVGLRREMRGSYFELAAFWMEKENFFFRDADGFNLSDGRTRHIGVEAEVFVPVTAWMDIAASGTYAEHTYQFTNAVNANSTESILSGDDMDSAPRTLANLRAIFYPLETVRAELELVHVGKYFTDASNAHEYDGHNVLNMRATWQPREDIELFVAVRNVTDEAYAERADYFFGNDRYFPGEPRALEFGISRSF